jgi:hypothetical protein
MTLRSWIFVLAALAGACGGNDASTGTTTSGTAPDATLDGDWTGTWLSRTGVGGALGIDFMQSGSVVSGDATFTGSPCFAGAHLDGDVTGRDFNGVVRAGAIQVNVAATLSGNTLDGTYDAQSAGACSGDTGTFTLHR